MSNPNYFGEGLAMYNRILYQLTWQSQVGLKYAADEEISAATQPIGTFSYTGEGWGLTCMFHISCSDLSIPVSSVFD